MKRFCSVLVLACLVAAVALPPAAFAHERKEVAGLAVVFGAEPEPALTGEIQYLRWRFSSLDGEDPYTEIADARAVVRRGGQKFGPFDARGSRRDPGLYQTRHIFTAPGEYAVTLTFRKGEAPEQHSVEFTYRIGDRAELEIPLAQEMDRHAMMHGGGDPTAVVATLEAYAAALEAKDVDAMAALVTEDFLVFEGAGVNDGWADYRDNHLGPELEMFTEIDYSLENIEAEAAGSLAWASFRYSIHIVMPDREVDSGGVGSAVLHRGDDGAWRIRHLHTSAEAERRR